MKENGKNINLENKNGSCPHYSNLENKNGSCPHFPTGNVDIMTKTFNVPKGN